MYDTMMLPMLYLSWSRRDCASVLDCVTTGYLVQDLVSMRGDDWLTGALPTVLPVDEEPTADELNEMLVNVKTYVCQSVTVSRFHFVAGCDRSCVVTPRLSSLLCLCLPGRRKS